MFSAAFLFSTVPVCRSSLPFVGWPFTLHQPQMQGGNNTLTLAGTAHFGCILDECCVGARLGVGKLAAVVVPLVDLERHVLAVDDSGRVLGPYSAPEDSV